MSEDRPDGLIPYPIPDAFTEDADGNTVSVRNLIPRGRPTFEQNIRGHAFNALTVALGGEPWMALSRRLEIANAIGDAILAFLAPLAPGDAPALTYTAYDPVVIEFTPDPRPVPEAGWCRVYWGSHGCDLERGHVQRDGTPHDCGCCDCERHPYPDWPDEGVLCVAKEPHYGPGTNFYGEDATPESVGKWGQVIESTGS